MARSTRNTALARPRGGAPVYIVNDRAPPRRPPAFRQRAAAFARGSYQRARTIIVRNPRGGAMETAKRDVALVAGGVSARLSYKALRALGVSPTRAAIIVGAPAVIFGHGSTGMVAAGFDGAVAVVGTDAAFELAPSLLGIEVK